jgi:hypothetical protein
MPHCSPEANRLREVITVLPEHWFRGVGSVTEFGISFLIALFVSLFAQET